VVPVRTCPLRVRASGLVATAEEPGSAVPLGLDPVIMRAQRLPVGVGGEPPVGDRVDVVVLEVVGPVAAGGGADVAVELWRRSEIQRGAEHGRVAPAEVGDGVEFGAGVQYRFEERVAAEFFGEGDWDWPAPDDVARFIFVGVTPPPGLQVADDHEIRPLGLALPASVLRHPHKRLGRQRRPAQLHLGVVLSLGALIGLQPEPVRFGIEDVHERDAELRRELTGVGHIAQRVDPGPVGHGGVLAVMELLRIDSPHPPITSAFPERAEALRLGHREQVAG
jgi:hypothetical protein